MKINMYGKCDNCGEHNLPVIEIQDTSSYGSWVGLCERCLRSAKQMLELDTQSLLKCNCGSVAGVHCDWCQCYNMAGK
jgi:hypothetical protein